MSEQAEGDKNTSYMLGWFSMRISAPRWEIERVTELMRNLVGTNPDPTRLRAFQDDLLELRAAVETLSNAADDLERGAATPSDEGQP